MTIYSLDILLSLFGTNLLFHVQFYCCFLTCIQISQEAGKVLWYSHLVKNFPQFVVIHIVEGFGIVSKAEIDVFLELSCFFDNPTDVGNLISSSSAFLNPAWTSGNSRFMYCWNLAWRILSITLLACVFLYFFLLITEEGFLICPCFSLELCIQMFIAFLFSFAFYFSSFHRYL